MAPISSRGPFAMPWSTLGRGTAHRMVAPSQSAPGALVEPWSPLVDDDPAESVFVPESPKSLRAIFSGASAYLHRYLQPAPRPTLSDSSLQPGQIVPKRPDLRAGDHTRWQRRVPEGRRLTGFCFHSSSLHHVGSLSGPPATSGFGSEDPRVQAKVTLRLIARVNPKARLRPTPRLRPPDSAPALVSGRIRPSRAVWRPPVGA